MDRTEVDFPFFEQNPVSSEVLVNLDESEIKDINDNLARYAEFKSKDPELQNILVRNGVTIEGQEQILERLFADLAVPSRRGLILWSKIDGSYMIVCVIFLICAGIHCQQKKKENRLIPKAGLCTKLLEAVFKLQLIR